MAAKLNGRRSQKQDCFRFAAQDAQFSVQPRFGISCVVSLVNDYEVKCGWWGQLEESLHSARALSITKQEFFVEQREWYYRPRVAIGPFTVQIGLFETVAQRRAVKGNEILVETAHLVLPFLFDDECLRAHDQHAAQLTPRVEFAENKPGFDGLAHADFIGNQQSRAVSPEQPQDWTVLVRNVIDPPLVE